MLDWLFRFLSRKHGRCSDHGPPVKYHTRLKLEILETRDHPSLISGYVFHDLNHNGLRDPGEPGLAGIPIELRNSAGQVVATATTGPNGYYFFDRDILVSAWEIR